MIALHDTLRGFGPFAALPPNDSLLMLQAFVGTVTVTALIVAAVVSERQRANEVLRHTEHRFRALIEKSSDAIGLIDAQGIILYVSPSTESLLGYRSQELVGRDVFQYVHPEDRPRAAASLSELLRHPDRIVTVELRARHQNGSWYWLESRGRNLLHDPDVRALIVNSRDITERKRYQTQLQASLREKEVLLKEIHHRVKNNLQVISSLLNLQAETFSHPQILEVFRESQSRIKSMALVHESLYGASDLAHVDVEAYLRRLTDHLWRSYGPRAQAIILEMAIDHVALTMDTAIPCGLIINELISNAIVHGFPQGQPGRIRVQLRQDAAGHVTLAVSDTGVGPPAEFRLEEADTLGLRLVRALTEQLGGTLTLARRHGTTLTVAFAGVRGRPTPASAVEPATDAVTVSNGAEQAGR
jgi:PAS domain S-box-containing protein